MAKGAGFRGGGVRPGAVSRVERLASEVRYEAPAASSGAGTAHLATASEFPHVYRPIDTAAITGVWVLVAGAGGFQWPRAFVGLEAYLFHSTVRGEPR